MQGNDKCVFVAESAVIFDAVSLLLYLTTGGPSALRHPMFSTDAALCLLPSIAGIRRQ